VITSAGCFVPVPVTIAPNGHNALRRSPNSHGFVNPRHGEKTDGKMKTITREVDCSVWTYLIGATDLQSLSARRQDAPEPYRGRRERRQHR
jgi:hypothetical protein